MWIAACAAIGVVIALALSTLITQARVSGVFEGWDELATTPPGAAEMLVDERGALFVRASSGEEYRYTWGTEDKYWVRDEPSQDSSEAEFLKVTQPCDFSSPELSRFRNSTTVIDCVQVYHPEPEGFAKRTFVLDHDGTVRYWHHAAAASGGIVALSACSAIVGGIVGLVAGIGTSRWVFRKPRAKV
jgi:hypothetical protein